MDFCLQDLKELKRPRTRKGKSKISTFFLLELQNRKAYFKSGRCNFNEAFGNKYAHFTKKKN